MSTPSPAFPSMSRSCSRRSRIRCACRAAALFWGAATAAGRALAGQQPDPALVGEVARLLAAADARSFDASLLGTALGRVGGAEAAAAVRDILGNGTTPGVVTAPARRAALVEAWRLGERAPTSALAGYADDPDPAVRWRALYALGRLRARQGASVLVTALQDPDPQVRAAAARGLSRALLDS